MSKVPAITLAFWVMKICATTLGETAGDLLSMTLNVGYAISSLILISIFIASLALQLRAQKFHPFLYWTVILTTSTAGTTMSDYMDRTLGLGYVQGSLILITLLAVVLLLWRRSGHSLSVQHISDRRVEMYYWTAILVSNTLGTAFGDFLADSSGLGFAYAWMLISGVLGIIILAYFVTSISHVVLFWAAFVLTRPFGATLGDLLTKSQEKGGLDLGTMGASAVLFGILLVLIVDSSYRGGRKHRIH